MNGFVIDAFDTHTFVNRMNRIVTDNIMFHKMSNSALLNSERFTIDEIGEKWKELIERI